MNPQGFLAGKREHAARVARAQFEFSLSARKRMNSKVLPDSTGEGQSTSTTKAVQLHRFGVDVGKAAETGGSKGSQQAASPEREEKCLD